jgi:MATE family multidrug resistance protein
LQNTQVQGSDVTSRDVLAIAIPMIVSNATVPLVGIADTAVVGQLNDPALIGGVALGSTVFSMLFWAFGFLRMGTTGLTAQAADLSAEAPKCRRLRRPISASAS